MPSCSSSAGAGHFPWLDRPELLDRVAAFLHARQRAAPGARLRRGGDRRLAAGAWLTASRVYVIAAPSSPDLAAASYRSDLFRASASRCGTTPGTAATTCRPTRCSPRRSARCSARCSRRVDDAAAALFAALIDGRFPPARRAHRGAVVRAGADRRSPAASPDLGLAIGLARSCSRSAGAARWRWRRARVRCARSRAPSRARSSRWRRSPGRLAGPRKAARRARCGGARADRRCSCWPSGRRLAAVRRLGFFPRSRSAGRSAPLIARRLRVLRTGGARCTRSLAGGRRLCDPVRGRRQRRPPRRALRGPAGRLRARRRAARRAGGCCCSCSRPRCSTGRRTRRSRDYLAAARTRRAGVLLHAAARRAAQRSGRLLGDARRGSRWCRCATTGRRAASPRT